MTLRTCAHEWLAPRADCPTSIGIRHVCGLVEGHEPPCECECGADERVWPHWLREVQADRWSMSDRD